MGVNLGPEEMDGAQAGADLGRFRQLKGPWKPVPVVFTVVGVLLSVNQIFYLKFFAGFVILDNS